jgi:hypothetical protein
MRLRTIARRVPTSASLVLAALLGLVSTTFPATPAAAVPPYTVEERAVAIASPALVLVDAAFEGYVRNRTTGELVYDQPLNVHNRCTGIVVSADGNVVTPTHCLSMRADDLRQAAAAVVANEMIRVGKLAAGQRDSFAENVRKTADFTGTTKEAAPVATVSAQLFVATNTTDSAITGKIVKSQPPDKGRHRADQARCQGPAGGQARQDPVQRRRPRSCSPPSRARTPPPPRPPSRWATRSSGSRARTTRPTRRRSSATTVTSGPTWHGAMVLDNDGNVIGMVTTDQSSTNRTPRLAQDNTPIFALLTDAGVSNEQTNLDRTYRDGLDDYYAGRYPRRDQELRQGVGRPAEQRAGVDPPRPVQDPDGGRGRQQSAAVAAGADRPRRPGGAHHRGPRWWRCSPGAAA